MGSRNKKRLQEKKRAEEQRVTFFMLAFVALASGLLATVMGLGSRQVRQEADLVESLSVRSAAALREARVGEDVLVEGTLARDNPVLFRGFVTYLHFEPHEDTTGSTRGTDWKVAERFTPPLRVETATGRVHIRNESYRLGAATDEPPGLGERGTRSWQKEVGWLEWSPSVPATGPQWYTGFEAGEKVVILGTLARGGEMPEVEATLVFGGTQAELVPSAREAFWMFLVMAWVLGPVSAGSLLALGRLVWRRFARG